MARQYGYDSIELECDGCNLSKAIVQKKFGQSRVNLVIEDICIMGDNLFNFLCFSR